MNLPASKEPYDGYCGTSYAAKLLGISVGTVQGLVEKNDLKAWKTQGGHRRISLQSIREYQRRHNLMPASLMQGEDRLRVLVVEDDENTRLMCKHVEETSLQRLGMIVQRHAKDMCSSWPEANLQDRLQFCHKEARLS